MITIDPVEEDMDSRKIVLKETAVAAMGVSLCSAVMVGVFALMGYFDIWVLVSAVVGAALSVANFYVMAICSSLAADKAAAGDVKGGKALLGGSFAGRMAVLFLLLAACAMSGLFNLFALSIPLIFVQPTITIGEFFRKSGEKKS